jgi:chemotaxis protein CheC
MTHPVCADDASRCAEGAAKLELVQQLFAAATYDASAAMCCWTNNLITLTLDEVYEAPLAEACVGMCLGDDRMIMVVMNLEGELAGTMIMALSEENGRRLAASLLGSTPSDTSEWREMQDSALAETGNILSGAYMNAITRLIDHNLVPTVPYLVYDHGTRVLEEVVANQARGQDSVLICHTGFHYADENLSWQVLFLPTVALRKAMETAMQRHSSIPKTPKKVG